LDSFPTHDGSADEESLPIDEPSSLGTRRILEDQGLNRLARIASLDPNDGIPL
jgi:hypothetical protein